MNLIFGILVAVVLVIGAIMLIAFCIAIVMAIIEFALLPPGRGDGVTTSH